MAKLEEVWRRPELLAVTDYAEDYIALFDRGFRHLFVNRKVAQTLGRGPEDFIGKSLAQVGMPPELCELWETRMAQVLATAKPVTFDSRMSLPGGSFLLETLLAPVKDSDGGIQALTAITRDVTAWKRDQALRNAQNEVMRQIAQGAGLPELMATMVRLSEQNAPGRLCSLLLLSEDGRYLTPGSAPNLPQELIQAICAKPIGPDNACCGAAAYHKRLVVAEDLTRHDAWSGLRQLAHKHGLRACWSQPILSADGELLGTFAMYHKNARAPYENELLVVNEAALMAAIAIPHCREHESLLESETRYRMLTENAANIVSVNDANGVLRYVSPAVEPILGYKPEELVGHPAGEHLHPDDLPGMLESRTRLREQIGSQSSLRYRYRHKDGSWRKLEATAKSSLDHRGNYISVVSARDITEREETTRALQESEERLERALDASRLGMWDWNLETGELIVDWHFSQTLGYAREDVQPNVKWLLAHMHPDDRQRVIDALTANLQGKTTYTELEYRGQTKAGDYRWVRTRGRVTQRRADGWALRMSGTNQDIDAERRIQASLDRALEASGLGLWDWNVETGSLFVDERCLAILDYTAETFAPKIETMSAISHPDDTRANVEAIQTHLAGKTPYYEIEYRAKTGSGNWKWVSSRGRVSERDPQGQPSRVSGTIKDIDAQRRIQQHLQRANTQIQLLLEATDEGIIGLDSDGVCTFVNPAATRFLRLSGEQLLGKPFDSMVRHTADDGTELIGHDSPMVRCLLEGQRFIGANELFWLDRNTAVPVEYSVSPLMADDRPAGAVLIFRDVSDKRALAQQLQHQALHDPLTGLVNRHGFEKELGLMLYNARTHKQQHALCYVDLDQFKLVNDTCGHAAGDELLRQLPAVLQPLARKGDTIARLGGDEFGILLEDCSLEQAARIAESVRDAVRDFRFVWQYRTFTIGASIGVVAINSDSLGLVSVLGAADAACYVAKDQGPNHVHVSYPHDLAIIRRRGEMRWVARIKTALEENQFRLHYQSIAALDRPDASATRHELLLRLVDAKGDLILPGAFLQAAERYQLMPAIDHWVIDHALRFVGQAVEPNPALSAHCFGINLSGESLRDLGLLDYIKDALKRHKVSASRLYFELTETAAISNLGAAVEFMRGLKNLGCKLALDDFGSGMSSFSYLKHLPVDYLKIDGSFIKDIVANPVDQAIVRAVTAVGQQMGIQTIAEYVETKAIRDCLLAMGVNYGQGYGIARPMPLENFTDAQQPPAAASA